MVFKGATNNQIVLYLRVPVPNATTGCNNPATHSGGSTTFLLTGNITTITRGECVAVLEGARRFPTSTP